MIHELFLEPQSQSKTLKFTFWIHEDYLITEATR